MFFKVFFPWACSKGEKLELRERKKENEKQRKNEINEQIVNDR